MITDTDRVILAMLRENSRRSLTEIASRVGLSRTTVKYHIDKLVDSGVIERFTIDVNSRASAPPAGIRAMFDVQLRRNACSMVFASIRNWDQIISVWSISGATDMRILAETADQPSIEELRDRLSRHPEVVGVTTSIILRTWR